MNCLCQIDEKALLQVPKTYFNFFIDDYSLIYLVFWAAVSDLPGPAGSGHPTLCVQVPSSNVQIIIDYDTTV